MNTLGGMAGKMRKCERRRVRSACIKEKNGQGKLKRIKRERKGINEKGKRET